jgi:Fe-S-cluster containining protein
MNNKKCSGCSMCCKYVAIEIDAPESREDFENIKWYVAHKNVNVYVDSDDVWHIEFLTPCEFLGENGSCTIYEKRPKICRDYSPDECLHYNEYEEKHTFKTLKDVEEYVKNKFKNNKSKG